MRLLFLIIFGQALTVRFNDVSALVLQEKALNWVVEYMITDIIHLLQLDKSDNIKVMSQLLLTVFKQPVLLIPISLFSAWAELFDNKVYHNILIFVLKILSV